MNLDAELALCRSALFEALAVGFRPPNAETLARLASPDGTAPLAVVAEVVGGAPLEALARRLAATGRPLDVLAHAYRDLFGHVAHSEVPPYETEYGADDLFLQPQELADVGGFYAAFGLCMAPAAAERVDHISCESEFLMFLARKEAFAIERGDDTMLQGTRAAARLFLRDHLGRFLPALNARLERADRGGFYATLGALATAFVRRECDRLGVPAGPDSLRLRVPIEDRIPMACGACPLGEADELDDGI